jgi:hypothetical protein
VQRFGGDSPQARAFIPAADLPAARAAAASLPPRADAQAGPGSEPDVLALVTQRVIELEAAAAAGAAGNASAATGARRRLAAAGGISYSERRRPAAGGGAHRAGSHDPSQTPPGGSPRPHASGHPSPNHRPSPRGCTPLTTPLVPTTHPAPHPPKAIPTWFHAITDSSNTGFVSNTMINNQMKARGRRPLGLAGM